MVNLGSQVAVADLVGRADAAHADAVLVSQVVTQRDAHIKAAREISEAFTAARGPARPLLVVGGPRFDPAMPVNCVDRCSARTTSREVASYLVHTLAPEPQGNAA